MGTVGSRAKSFILYAGAKENYRRRKKLRLYAAAVEYKFGTCVGTQHWRIQDYSIGEGSKKPPQHITGVFLYRYDDAPRTEYTGL